MIYLWLDTLFKETFQRQSEGGSVEQGVMPTLGATAFKQYYEYMSLEFPMITITHAFIDNMFNQFNDCEVFWTNMTDGAFANYTDKLCAASSDWSQPYTFDTLYKLVNIHKLGSRFNPEFLESLMNDMGQEGEQAILTTLRKEDGLFNKYVGWSEQRMFRYYGLKNAFENYTCVFCSDPSPVHNFTCSWQRLTACQWTTGHITAHPMPNMEKHIQDYSNSELGRQRQETSYSYRRLWLNTTMANGGGNVLNQTDFTPEVQYYTERAQLLAVFHNETLNKTNVLLYLDDDHLFNQQIWGNLLLPHRKRDDETSLKEFDKEPFKRYLKYVTFQAGLDGMFTVKTPKQVIEGYADNLVQSLQN